MLDETPIVSLVNLDAHIQAHSQTVRLCWKVLRQTLIRLHYEIMEKAQHQVDHKAANSSRNCSSVK
jgi:hypothetical protein